jgi:Na+-translocating ferredoxin:NAD+ oxidoreductase RnfD subunit
MGLGLAASVWIAFVRFAVVAAYWPHSEVLLWYFVLGCLNTMVAGAVTGAVIGAIVRRSHRTPRDAETRRDDRRTRGRLSA